MIIVITKKCKNLGCFGYCNYAKKQQMIFEANKRRDKMSRSNENHERCFHCDAYIDKCECDGRIS